MKRLRAIILGLLFVALGVSAFGFLSPWPAVLVMRTAFNLDASRRNEALVKHLRSPVREFHDIVYGDGDREALDLYLPARTGTTPPPLLFWTPGGAFVAGQKEDLAGYLRILADRGVASVAVGYRTAPEARYPTPVEQAGRALSHVLAHAREYGLKGSPLFLAGDSAGAQIAAQLALVQSDPALAERTGTRSVVAPTDISGMILFCGIYDVNALTFQGFSGYFLKNAARAYFGVENVRGSPLAEDFSVPGHIDDRFPPTFLSVGNADPLLGQSLALAEALRKAGVRTDMLFFDDTQQPPLGHEYQFDLDTVSGQQALARLLSFVGAE